MSDEAELYTAEVEAPVNGAGRPMQPDLSDPAAFVTELSAVTPYFEAQAVVRVRIGARVIALKIRSVPKEQLEQAMVQLRPKLPKYRDKQTGLLVIDEDSTPYRHWLQTYAYLKAILGLADITLRDKQGQVVWRSPNDAWERDMPAAVQALKDMAITTLQIEAISRAIDALSQVEQEQEVEELLGN
jgi:hypothetical protein